MGNKVLKTWTEQEDEHLRSLYAAGESWDKIGEIFGVSRGSAVAHGHRLGCTTRAHPSLTPRVRKQPPPPPPPVASPIERLSRSYHVLPPGHEVTWRPLVAGTLLDGACYPEPRGRV